MARPRITLTIAEGEVRLYLNPEGRDLLVNLLQRLNEKSEHFHLGTRDGAEVQLMDSPYDPHAETLVSSAKVLFRTDAWDRQYHPHLLSGDADAPRS